MIALLICLWLAWPAGSGMAADAGQTGGGTVRGRLVDADTGAPLSYPRVGSDTTGWVPAIGGEFVLRNVRPGRHVINLQGQYLATQLSLPVSVTMPPGGGVRDVELRVRLEGRVSGRVLDDAGAPVTDAMVLAVSAEYTRTGPYGAEPEVAVGLWYHREAVARTDGDGRYTLEGLRAGRPHRLLAFRPHLAERPISRAPVEPAARAEALRHIYYPAAPIWDAAATVIVSSEESREHVDIVLPAAPSLCVEATILADGAPAQMTLAVEPDDVARLVAGATTSRRALPVSGQSGSDGRVRYCGLAPGRYRLSAGETLGPMADEYRGSATFELADRDLTDVVVDTAAAVRVAGEVAYDGPALPDTPTVRIIPQTQVGPARPAEADVPGRFDLRLAHDRTYSLQVARLPPALYVSNLLLDGRSVLHEALAVPSGPYGSTLRVEVSAGAGQVAATVLERTGEVADLAVVVLLGADAQTPAQAAAGLRAALTDETGRAVIEGLPPGRYTVMATRVPPLMVVQLPSGRVRIARSPETLDLLARSRSLGELLTVAPGAVTPITLAPVEIR